MCDCVLLVLLKKKKKKEKKKKKKKKKKINCIYNLTLSHWRRRYGLIISKLRFTDYVTHLGGGGGGGRRGNPPPVTYMNLNESGR